jgi:hypothetical protein
MKEFLMNTLNNLLDHRGSIEKRLMKLTGRVIWVVQLNLSSFCCGCTGITIFFAGLEKESVEVFASRIVEILNEVAASVGLDPDIIYASLVPGSSEVGSISLKRLCDECRKDYGGDVKPWSNMSILYKKEC